MTPFTYILIAIIVFLLFQLGFARTDVKHWKKQAERHLHDRQFWEERYMDAVGMKGYNETNEELADKKTEGW